MSAARSLKGWTRCSRSDPCPICDRADHQCRASNDGRFADCYREQRPDAEVCTDKAGAVYYRYQVGPDPESAKPASRAQSIPIGSIPPERGKPDLLHEVYSALLAVGNLKLTGAHRDDLKRRGFSDEAIERVGYRSLPLKFRNDIAGALADKFGRQRLLSVPGFVVRDDRSLSISGSPGMLMPVRDIKGRIVALTLKPDDPQYGKYLALTSKANDNRQWDGPSPGSPAHVPTGIKKGVEVVRVTEGILKADLAHVLSDTPTIGGPGVDHWKATLPILKVLDPVRVRIAFDADSHCKPQVKRALHDFIEALWSAGYEVEVEEWEEADGKGIDDLLAAGKTPRVLAGDDVEGLHGSIAASFAPPPEKPDEGSGGDEEKESQAAVLLRLAADLTLFHTDDGRKYATIDRDGHAEHLLIRRTPFREYLTKLFYDERGHPPSAEAMQGALGVLEAKATYEGTQEAVWVRVAPGPDDCIFIDLCNDEWQAVRVDRKGWEVVDDPPVKFRRAKGMLPLPMPERGGKVDDLRRFVNVRDDNDWLLMVACLAADFLPRGPYPIRAFSGEQGSAKSTTARVNRMMVDPNSLRLRCEPKEVRDMMIAATNAWIVAYDNISRIPVWLSDALCRLSTGGGFATRTLYENEEETIFDAQRPVILNGIEDFAARDDLRDRCVFFHLPTIPEKKRREERAFWEEFDAAYPRLLGAMLDAVSGGLRMRPDVRLHRLPRMADFAVWGEAVGRGLDWKENAFLDAYTDNRDTASAESVEDSPVASAVRSLMANEKSWEGTAANLLARLEELVDEKTVKSRSWPKAANALSGWLRRSAPALRAMRIDVDFRVEGHRNVKRIAISHVQPEDQGESSVASVASVADPTPDDASPSPGGELRTATDIDPSASDRSVATDRTSGSVAASSAVNGSRKSYPGDGVMSVSPVHASGASDASDLSPALSGDDFEEFDV